MGLLFRVLVGLVLAVAATSVAQAAFPGVAPERLHLHMEAAVDRDCDGRLNDEADADRSFSTQKSLQPGQCIIYRTEYRNEGSFPIRYMRVSNRIPQMMKFVSGSAEHLATPPGLWPEETVTPVGESSPAVIWRFGGTLAPGEGGALQFRVRLDPPR